MFVYIRFGSSKSVFRRGLENDLAYTIKFVVMWLLSIYIRSLDHRKRDKVSEKVSVEAESLRGKVDFGSQSVGRGPVRFCIGWRVLILFCASVLHFCYTEVELFVLIKLSRSADFALHWQSVEENFCRLWVEFCNTFVLIRDSGLCLFLEKGLQRINPSLGQANCIKASGS